MVGKSRSSLVIMANTGTSSSPSFTKYPASVIPLTKSGYIKWFADDDRSWKESILELNDRVLIKSRWFGSAVATPPTFEGCSSKSMLRVSWILKAASPTPTLLTSSPSVDLSTSLAHIPAGKEVFLASCSPQFVGELLTIPSEVSYDLKAGFVESQNYFYKFKTDNHMLFESVMIKRSDGALVEIASDGDLLIRSDVKKFFTLNFNASDIESHLKSHRSEIFGLIGTLGFYLKVAFFRISLDLDTDVHFFNSSAHIPMVLTIPVDASKKLNKKSGVLYSFFLGEGVALKSSNLPKLSTHGDNDRAAMAQCSRDACSYELSFGRAETNDHASLPTFSMDLILPRRLVDRGMYPQYVEDVVDAAKDMSWQIPKSYRGRKRVGLYLEVSGLNQGEHPWDFRMTLRR